VDGPLSNDTITYRYDALGQLASVENALSQVVSYSTYDAYGHATEVTDVNGVVTELAYSRRGQVLSQTFDPQGLALGSSSTYQDDLLLESVSPKGAVTVKSYDGYRRLQSTARRATPTGADLEKALYSYNFEGQRTLEELRDAAGALQMTTSSSHGKSADPSDSVVRDFVRLEAPTGSGHTTTTWSDESGRPVTRQDPSGHLTLYAYDARGRLQSVTEQDVSDGQSSVVDHVTTYDYDDAGNLTQVTDPEGLETTYEYDDFGRMLEVVSPDSGTTRYAYDVAGRLTGKTQGVGTADEQTTAYAYDELGRLLARPWPCSSTRARTRRSSPRTSTTSAGSCSTSASTSAPRCRT
jgi:YD repeat-containing protein